MKKINLIICTLILITFSFIYQPIVVNATENISFSVWEDYNISANINGTPNYDSDLLGSHGPVWLNSGVVPTASVSLDILSSWPYINGEIRKELINPKGVGFYVILGLCTDKPEFFQPEFPISSVVTGDFLYIKTVIKKEKESCNIDGHIGKLVHMTVEVTARRTTETTNSGQYYTTGSIVFYGNRVASTSSYNQIQYVQVFRSTSKTLEVSSNTETQADDTRGIFQKLADLPSDLWNFIKQIPSQVWNFFSGAFDTVTGAVVGIGNFILDLPGNIWNGLETGFNWITDGLTSLGTFLLNGLEDLFIPSDLSVNSLVDSFKNKLGFVYDVPATVISYGLNLSNISFTEMNSISLPTINIFGHNFWTSQNIDISVAINTFKPYRYITSIACVAFCVNALFKYKDKIFGGGGNYN